MKTTIQLNNIQDVKAFISLTENIPENLDFVQGRYVIDAKSIMGIFSLDLSRPLILDVGTNDENRYNEICAIFNQFLV